MPNYFNAFNIFEYRRNILDRLDVSYERAYMVTPKEEHFDDILDQLIKHNRCHGTPMSNKNIQEAVIRVMEDEKKMPNVTSITLLRILCFSPPTLSMHKRKM